MLMKRKKQIKAAYITKERTSELENERLIAFSRSEKNENE